MICAVMQPTYLPWVGYFDLIDRVEKFVFYDDVQMIKSTWHVRNRVKTSNGELWLTVNINNPTSFNETTFLNAPINYASNWNKKHIKTFESYYRKSRFFEEVYPFFYQILMKEYSYLGELNTRLISGIAEKIGIQTPFVYSSHIDGLSGNKDERLVVLLNKINCNEYLSPPGAAEYINRNNPGGEFPANNIDLYYHNYEHPTYEQLYGDFVPYLSIIDLLFNCGFKNALQVIRSGRKQNIHFKEMMK